MGISFSGIAHFDCCWQYVTPQLCMEIWANCMYEPVDVIRDHITSLPTGVQ